MAILKVSAGKFKVRYGLQQSEGGKRKKSPLKAIGVSMFLLLNFYLSSSTSFVIITITPIFLSTTVFQKLFTSVFADGA